jgi:class 3 adenylate cyclase/ketosteroid isomerase-like protein
MAPSRSPELEAVVQRILNAYAANDLSTLSNLMSSDPAMRFLGFDSDEWWVGLEEFLKVFETQAREIGDITLLTLESVEAFEEGTFGWAAAFTTIRQDDLTTSMRSSAVFRIEAGAWKALAWHNSVPVPNQQVFGVDLTKTLDSLVSALRDDVTNVAIATRAEGTMTLVFTDIVDSTLLAEHIGDVTWADLVRRHGDAIATITDRNGGRVVKLLGDGSMLAFESARAAVRTAVGIQKSVANEPYSVRIGIHTGEIIRTGDDLLGLTVNKAARVASAAGANQIMVSSTTLDVMGSIPGVTAGETRIVTLKGLSDAHQVTTLEWS